MRNEKPSPKNVPFVEIEPRKRWAHLVFEVGSLRIRGGLISYPAWLGSFRIRGGLITNSAWANSSSIRGGLIMQPSWAQHKIAISPYQCMVNREASIGTL